MEYYKHLPLLKYPPLKPGETRKRKIAGVTVVQRHDWTELRYREIKASIECKGVNYSNGMGVSQLQLDS